MMGEKSILDLQIIVSAGGCVSVDANDYSPVELNLIASAGKKSNGKIIIRNADNLKTMDCRMIALQNPGNVTFNFQSKPL